MLRQRLYFVISVPVFILLYSFTAINVFLVLTFSYIHWKKGVYAIMYIWAKSVFPIMGKRLHFSGKELLDKNKKYILLANHSSLFDIIAIMAFFPRVSWFGHERLLKIPLFGKMLLMTDYIPMTMANIRNTRRMVEQLIENSENMTIAIFPEGTRTLNGKLNPFYLTPHAIANDGLLDICLIKKLGLLKRLDILLKVSKGAHTNDKKVHYHTTEKFEVDFGKTVPFHVDGEVYYASEFDVKIFPSKIPVIFNPEGDHYFNLDNSK